MPALGWQELSGYGQLELDPGSFVALQAISAYLGTVSTTSVRVLGSSDPRIVQFGGSIGVTSPDTDASSATIDEVNWIWPLNRTPISFVVPTLWWNSGALYIGKLVWWLPPGVTWWVNANW